MSEKNMTEKLAESISKLIKKTNTFEKVETMLKCVSLFMFITGAVTLYNSYKLDKIIDREEKKTNANIIETNETLNKILLLIENNIKLCTPPNHNEHLNSPVSLIENKPSNVQIYDDDEILNECYDNIPCNNFKKVTGLNSLFEWK